MVNVRDKIEDDGRALRDAIRQIIFNNYIGVSASQTKAERCADKVIECLLIHYAQFEDGEVVDGPVSGEEQ
jgi:hypothetical protein